MSSERWRSVRDRFDEAVELPPPERAAFLERLRTEDGALHEEVASLLRASAAAGEFLEAPAVSLVRESPFEEERRSRIGPYTVIREIGHGGMGTVYLAARTDQGFENTVAVKLVRRGMDTDFILERFRNERRILADLDHPNIARILDGGSTEDGLPYFVMEYIPGSHLLDDAAARGLSIREKLALFRKVCAAVAYAHRHLVVHRDLKPSNILVTPEGEPKLLDFGLARVLQPESAGEGDRTATALRLLTPDYASPEQVRGERIATSSDIYSLGVVLYELLAGRRPYRTTGAGLAEIARSVCEEEPPRPSTAVPALRGDVDNIVLVALRKEPERRYASVEALAADIGRHLDGRPVHARKDTFAYRSGKFVARHKAGVAAAVVVTALLIGALAATIRQTRIARAERAIAEAHFNDVRQLADTFLFEFHDAIKDLPGSTPARRLVVRRALEYLEKLSKMRSDDLELQRELAGAYERVARVQGGMYESHLGETEGARESLERAIAIRKRLLAGARPTAADRAALAEAELQLCQVLLVTGDGSGALASARVASDLLAASSREAPADAALRARATRARRYLGMAFGAAGEPKLALRELRGARDGFEALAAASPQEVSYRRELGVTHQHIVYSLAGTAERAEAESSYAEACRLLEGLYRERPDLNGLQRELAYTHVSMGTFCEWSGDAEGALRYYSRALPVLETLVRQDPKNADARLLLAEDCNNVGYAMVRSGAPGDPLALLRRSEKLLDALIAEDPANTQARLGRARLYESLGSANDALAARTDAGRAPALRREAAGWYGKSVADYVALRERGALGTRGEKELEDVRKKVGP
ncbi:MAG TPA: protein kinase [Thermoanaerobaculia bacterium]|jgi:non-specific serine/threonine protein kinase/serine/threonine-protein kinase|nr:protein kinase [Thermoanaerobaculia bacterium]